MYVIFNLDGSIKEQVISEFIQQGNNEVNAINVAIEDRSPATYNLEVSCKLPNGDVFDFSSFSVVSFQDKKGKWHQGYQFAISSEITSLVGIVRVNLVCLSSNDSKVLVTYSLYLSINEGVSNQVAAVISEQEYQNLLTRIGNNVLTNQTILTFDVLPSVTGFVDKQVILVVNESTRNFYQLQSGSWVLLFDALSVYSKNEVNAIATNLQNQINNKSKVIGAVSGDYWTALNIDGVTHLLGEGGGGGGGEATYSAGTGISIDNVNFIISIDDTVVATKTWVDSELEDITSLIPSEATPTNQLADKAFVNSSIATNTANFLGTYNIVSDLDLPTSASHSQVAQAIATKLASLSITPTNNDYVFVAYPDATVSTEYTQFDRYKYGGSAWEYEYTLNNSSFTAQQWAAINSGITTTKVSNYDSHLSATNNPHSVTKEQVNLGSVVNAGMDNSPTSDSNNYVKSGGVYTALGLKVDKTTTVNGHPLSSNVTVTKSDVGLGSVANTGDSDTPVSGGTTKFTTGGAYTELAKKEDYGKLYGKQLPSNPTTNENAQFLRLAPNGGALSWADVPSGLQQLYKHVVSVTADKQIIIVNNDPTPITKFREILNAFTGKFSLFDNYSISLFVGYGKKKTDLWQMYPIKCFYNASGSNYYQVVYYDNNTEEMDNFFKQLNDSVTDTVSAY